MNSKVRVVCLLLASLLIAAMITHNGDVAWMMLPFLAYLVVGILQVPEREMLRLRAERTLEQSRSDGLVSIETNVTIANESPAAVHLYIQDTQQTDMNITGGELSKWVTLQPEESTKLNYSFSAIRGDFSWKSIRIVACDPLGLIGTEINLPAAAGIQIRPVIKKFKAIPLRPRSTLHSPGSIPARLGGSGTDFYGVREYHPGDPLRSLDWRMTARHPFKLFTKEFEQEEIAEIGLILDARQNTDLRRGDESMFEYGIGAAASLAETFLHQGHRVSLLVFGKKMSIAFPGYGKTQLHRIMSCLSKARVETDERLSTHLDFLPIRMFPSHSLIIVISSLSSADRSFYQRLRAYGYQALLISPDPIDFAHSMLAQDFDTKLAIRAARLERRLLLDTIAHFQIPVIDWHVSQPLFPLVRNALTHSRGQGEY